MNTEVLLCIFITLPFLISLFTLCIVVITIQEKQPLPILIEVLLFSGSLLFSYNFYFQVFQIFKPNLSQLLFLRI